MLDIAGLWEGENILDRVDRPLIWPISLLIATGVLKLNYTLVVTFWYGQTLACLNSFDILRFFALAIFYNNWVIV